MEEIGPQADGRQVLINDDRLMITDFVHTENADDAEVRKRTVEGNAKLFTHCQLKEVFIKLKQVSGINRKLKKKIYIHR